MLFVISLISFLYRIYDGVTTLYAPYLRTKTLKNRRTNSFFSQYLWGSFVFQITLKLHTVFWSCHVTSCTCLLFQINLLVVQAFCITVKLFQCICRNPSALFAFYENKRCKLESLLLPLFHFIHRPSSLGMCWIEWMEKNTFSAKRAAMVMLVAYITELHISKPFSLCAAFVLFFSSHCNFFLPLTRRWFIIFYIEFHSFFFIPDK